MTTPAGCPLLVSFQPTSLPLDAVAQRIRGRLGDWPVPPMPPIPTRFCMSPPTPALPTTPPNDLAGDVIVLTADGLANASHRASGRSGDDASGSLSATVPICAQSCRLIRSWLARGASVLDVSGDLTLLFVGDAQFALEGVRHADWLAALAAFVDCGFALHDALTLALAWRDPGALIDETGPAWPAQLVDFPRVPGLPARAPAVPSFPSCPTHLGLYPVVPDADWVERLIAVGVRTVQLRFKSDDTAAIRAQIARAVAAARAAPYEVRLFINDHWQLAIEAGAYGVHLGQEDLQTADCAAIATAGLRLGLSTHGYYEIVRALHFRPSYIACGAIFPTATKDVATPPQGLARLAAYVMLLQDVVPVVAIGGIDQQKLAAVSATGVGGAAVVSAVTAQVGSAPDGQRPKENDLKQLVATLQSAFNA